MKSKIHRGLNQIGGNIVEIYTDSTRVLLDVGLDLIEENNVNLPNIPGLFDHKGFDAVFISHYHGDHLGLAYSIHKDIPLYLGVDAYKIIKASDNYKKKSSLNPTELLQHGIPVKVGDITITPFLVDHSAYESFMLLAEAQGERILYTGDFRGHGRKDFSKWLSRLPQNVDQLITEGTTLSRPAKAFQTESDLEQALFNRLSGFDGPVFVLQSSMNIDRIVTMYRTSKKLNRLFLEELYMAEITSVIGGSIPNPLNPSFSDVKAFVTRGYSDTHPRYKLFQKYGRQRIGKAQIVKQRFMMCVRSSMGKYIKSIMALMPNQKGILIYSFWNGYKQEPTTKAFLELCQQLNIEVIDFHTSGHADETTIKALIDHVKPKEIIAIHTENAAWFKQFPQYRKEAD
jgi:ribonuclease J